MVDHTLYRLVNTMANRTVGISAAASEYLLQVRREALRHETVFRAAVDVLLLEHGVTGEVELVDVLPSGGLVVREADEPAEYPDPEKNDEVSDGKED